MKHVDVVCAVIKNKNGEILCCKRGPGRALEGCWEFPGGKVESSETYEQTIVREIKEELHTIIKPVKYLGDSYYEYLELDSPFSIMMYAYECELIEGNFELTEHTDKKWIRKEDLSKYNFAKADLRIIEYL